MQTLKKLNTISLNALVPLLISQEILEKIQYSCKKINSVEWSGVLFYKLNGSIKDVANLSIEVKDILLMDKGTKTFTAYNFDGDVAEFIMDKAMEDPDWMNIKLGHIHSHNSMNVFFSGVDIDELQDNVHNHNFYLSLIVNNYDEMTAKIAFKVSSSNIFNAKDEQGEIYEMSVNLEGNELMFVYDCDVQKPPVIEIPVPTTFAERLTYISEKAEREAKELKEAEEAKRKAAAANQPTGQRDWENPNKEWNKDLKAWVDKINDAPKFPSDKSLPERAKTLLEREAFDSSDFDRNIDEPDLLEDLVGINESFLCCLLRKGEDITGDSIDEVITELEKDGEPIEGIVAYVITNFSKTYLKFFNEKIQDVEHVDYVDTIDATIDTLDDLVAKSKLAEKLHIALTEYGAEIEASWKNKLFTIQQ